MEADFDIESEDQFWEELDDVVSTPCRTHDRIDDTLRTWLSLVTSYRDQYVQSEDGFSRCALALLESELFRKNDNYVRRQLVEGLLQEDDPSSLHLLTAFLLYSGRQNELAYEVLASEGVFPRLVSLIRDSVDDDQGLHRQMLELLYELSRMQQLSWDDLTTVDDAFILYLLQILESISTDVHDPYHGPVIHALLVLNEQYMLCGAADAGEVSGSTTTNRLLKALSMHGGAYKTFGESVILLLNRESETSLQLLILKTLYLLFTTPQTYEYFYTNDLYVLTDILVRNVLDLPMLPDTQTAKGPAPTTSTASLRHTYLRVLHPLLAHTQLRYPPHYKRADLRHALLLLAHDPSSSSRASPAPDSSDSPADSPYLNSSRHFEALDPTTVRLVRRCLAVSWLAEASDIPTISTTDAAPSLEADADAPPSPSTQLASAAAAVDHLHPASAALSTAGAGAGQAALARRAVSSHPSASSSAPGAGVGVNAAARESSLSLHEVAAQRERPGVLTPSRGVVSKGTSQSLQAQEDGQGDGLEKSEKSAARKAVPVPPVGRRRGRRVKVETERGETAQD